MLLVNVNDNRMCRGVNFNRTNDAIYLWVSRRVKEDDKTHEERAKQLRNVLN